MNQGIARLINRAWIETSTSRRFTTPRGRIARLINRAWIETWRWRCRRVPPPVSPGL